jgi:trimethylamine--corrinoid protein Co-methyltransferase
MVGKSRRRGGGRDARLAARAAPLALDQKPVLPGLTGGRYKPLEDSDVDRIWASAFELLETVGMADAIPHCIDLVTRAGGTLTDDGRLLFPEKLLDWTLEVAAKHFTLHGFDPAHDLQISDERVHFSTAGAAVLYLDTETRKYRETTLNDLYDMARLAHHMEHIHTFRRTMVPRDLTSSRELDLNTAYAIMAGTTKHISSSFFSPEHVDDVVEIFDMVLGETGAFSRRPFLSGANTVVVPPLRFAQDSCYGLVAQVKHNMPMDVLSAGQAGATSPAPLAGALVCGLAESLATLCFVNLMKPGHPVFLAVWPFVSDLRTGAMSGGSGEEAVLEAASAQIINARGLPSSVAAGMTDSKLPDAQAGYEKGVTVALAAQAGANIICESASMLASLLGTCNEMMVIDNDMLGSVARTVRGIEVDTASLSVEAIRKTVAGPQHFLGNPETLARMQTDYLYPEVAERLNPDSWEALGSLDMVEKARLEVKRLLALDKPDHICADTHKAICKKFPIKLKL